MDIYVKCVYKESLHGIFNIVRVLISFIVNDVDREIKGSFKKCSKDSFTNAFSPI